MKNNNLKTLVIMMVLIIGGTALKQVWVFILAPFIGAALSAIVYKFLNRED